MVGGLLAAGRPSGPCPAVDFFPPPRSRGRRRPSHFGGEQTSLAVPDDPDFVFQPYLLGDLEESSPPSGSSTCPVE